MMTEILKPLLENNVLTDEVKEELELSLTEAITATKDAVREEVEAEAKANFEAAKTKFEDTYKTLEESYKTKLEEAKVVATDAKIEIEDLESTIEDLETKPFVNVSESDMEDAEATLTEELEAKYEAAFDLAKEKFNATFEIVTEANSDIVTALEEALTEATETIEELETTVSTLETELEETNTELVESESTDLIAEAVAETEERMLAEADERVNEVKSNLVTSTEIFLEQELSEIKSDYVDMMKETQGRDLLESIKGLVKQHWDVDSEVAEEILEMKKEAEAKVEQYKDMLKKEHSRLEESQTEVEDLKKKVIVESKASILSSDKKEALTRLAENIEADKLETEIDSLMESVVDTFNAGFSKKEITAEVEKEVTTDSKEEEVITESVQTVISSGDTTTKPSDELANLMDLAGIR